MSLILKDNPVGIDWAIDRIQKTVFNSVNWDTAVGGYESYHRAYKNESPDGKIPEVYIGDDDYKEVFMDDGFSATSFFMVDDTITQLEEDKYSANVDYVFQVLLDELYPSIIHRADEEAHRDVLLAVNDSVINVEVTDIVKGRENVYSGLRIDQLECDDMHPYHFFKLGLTVNYIYRCHG